MPPAAVLGVGLASSAVGGMFSQSAANKGPRPVYGGLNTQLLSLLGGSAGKAGLGQAAFGGLTGIIQNPGALPDVNASVDPAFQALLNANKQMVAQGAAGVSEGFGASGLANSSAKALGLSNFYSQSSANFMNILAQYTLQAQQMAAANQLQASEFGANLFTNIAGTLTGPKGSVVGAGLGSLGGGLQTIGLLQSMGMLK